MASTRHSTLEHQHTRAKPSSWVPPSLSAGRHCGTPARPPVPLAQAKIPTITLTIILHFPHKLQLGSLTKCLITRPLMRRSARVGEAGWGGRGHTCLRMWAVSVLTSSDWPKWQLSNLLYTLIRLSAPFTPFLPPLPGRETRCTLKQSNRVRLISPEVTWGVE